MFPLFATLGATSYSLHYLTTTLSPAEVQRGHGAVGQPHGDRPVRPPLPGRRRARPQRGVAQPPTRPPDALRQPVLAHHLQGVSGFLQRTAITQKLNSFFPLMSASTPSTLLDPNLVVCLFNFGRLMRIIGTKGFQKMRDSRVTVKN